MSTIFVEDKTKDQQELVEAVTKKGSHDDSSIDGAAQDYIAKFLDMSNEAKENDQKEKTMPLKEGLRTFPKAIMWSLILSTALIMEGYDLTLLNSMYGFDAFNRKFGDYFPSIGKYQVPAKWQTGIAMAYSCGQLIGLYIAGYAADIYGYRKTLMTSLASCVGLIFIQFFAPNRTVLLVAYLLLGINWGAYQTITVTYASEVAPTTLRVYLTTYVNICWVIGQLIASCVLKGVSNLEGFNVYRIPYAIQWAWPIPLFIGVYLAPESPWYLVKSGRDEEAKVSLTRLLSENPDLPNKDVLASAMLTKIKMTVKEEANEDGKTASIFECFKGTNLRRTRVACFTWMFQSITGGSLMGYSTYFFIQAGLSDSNAFTFSIIMYILGILGTIASWFLSRRFGRFTIYFSGLVTMGVILIIVGGLGFKNSSGSSWAVGGLLLFFTLIYDMSIGPLTFCIVPEIPSAKLRTKTVMLSRNLYNIASIIIAIIMPYMLNPTAWNWSAKSGLLFAGFAFIGATWAWFDLPETKDRTFAELDQLFTQNIKARDFKTTEVDVFDAGHLIHKLGNENIKSFVQQTEHRENANPGEKA